jgi:glycosyltransferase involved in cell wall biosynthesis
MVFFFLHAEWHLICCPMLQRFRFNGVIATLPSAAEYSNTPLVLLQARPSRITCRGPQPFLSTTKKQTLRVNGSGFNIYNIQQCNPERCFAPPWFSCRLLIAIAGTLPAAKKCLFLTFPMPASPKISVVLPFRNAGRTLDRAIRSIVNQEEEDFELILVDNHSTDQGPAVAGKWVAEDRRLRVTREPLKGVVFASNKGAAEARGKYIARMDADDEAAPGRLRLQSAYLASHPGTDVVAGQVEHVSHSGQTGGFSRFVEWSNSICSSSEIYHNRFIELPVVNPTLMWRREIGERHGLYRAGHFPEDYEMILRWLDAGVTIEKIPRTVLRWYDSDTRLSRTHPAYSEKAFYRIKSRYLASWLQENNPYHPDVSVWGASRISRRRARLLEPYGIRFSQYIDTKKSRQLDKQVIYYEDLPPAGELFVLSYIRQMDNRDRIREFLTARGYREGKDFLMVS